MFTIIDRYIVRNVAVPLGAVMAIGLAMLLSDRMIRLLDTTLGKHNSFSVVFELLAYLVPHYLGLSVPIALLLGLLFGFNKMSKNSEIDALMASGFGLYRLIQPMIMIAILFSFATFLMFGWLQPYARFGFRSLIFEVSNVEVFYLAEEGVFMKTGNRTFILDSLNRATSSFNNVFVFEQTPDKGIETITAKTGELVTVPGETRPVLRLFDGNRMEFKQWPTFTTPDAQAPVLGTFEITDAPLGKNTKILPALRGESEREWTFPELYGTGPEGDHSFISANAIRTELHKRWVYILTIIILPFLASPFALGIRRSNHNYRIGVAIIIMIAFHQMIERGAVLSSSSGLSPYLSLWLPFFILTAFTVWRFYFAAFTLKVDWLDLTADRLGEWASDLTEKILRRRKKPA